MEDSFTIPSHVDDLTKCMYELQQEGTFCDAGLECKDGVIFVHKLVLMACKSPYLRNQLASESQGTRVYVSLKNYSLKTVCCLVQTLYTGQLNISQENKVNFRLLCQTIGLNNIKFAAENFIQQDQNIYEVQNINPFCAVQVEEEIVESQDEITALVASVNHGPDDNFVDSTNTVDNVEDLNYDSSDVKVGGDMVKRSQDLEGERAANKSFDPPTMPTGRETRSNKRRKNFHNENTSQAKDNATSSNVAEILTIARELSGIDEAQPSKPASSCLDQTKSGLCSLCTKKFVSEEESVTDSSKTVCTECMVVFSGETNDDQEVGTEPDQTQSYNSEDGGKKSKKVAVSIMDYNITIPEYSQDLSKHMYQLQQTGVLCDAWLVCKDGVVFVHKLVLMACGSAYLQQQLSADTSSSSQCQVFLKDYSLKTVYDFVQALYTGSFTLCHDRAIDILKLCTFLNVTVFSSTIQGIVDNDPNLKREFDKGGRSNNMNRIFYEVEIAKDSSSAPFKVPVKVKKSNIIMERIEDNSLKTKDIFSQSSVESPRRNRILVIKSDTTENTKRKNNTEATHFDGCIPKKQTRVSKQTLNVVQTSPNIFPPQTKLGKETKKKVANSPCCPVQSDHTYETDNTKELLNIAKSLSTSTDSACIELSDIDEHLPTLSDGTISELDKSKTLSTSTDMRTSGKDGEQQEPCQLCQKVSEDAVEKKNGQYICKGCVSLFTGENSQTNGEKKKKGRKGKKEKKDLFDTPKSKRKNRQYHHQALLDAYYAVKDGGIPVRTACRLYGVPRETLRDRLDGKRSIDCENIGRGTLFTKEEENKLADEVSRMAKCGYYYTCKEITDIATDYCVLMEKRTSDQHLTLKWYRGFFNRWPELQMLYTKRPRKRDILASAAESKNRFFKEFGDLLDKHDFTFKPHFVFNLHVSVIKTKESQSIGVIGCGSASGIAIPPYFIFQEQETHDNAVNSMNNIPTVVSENGYTSFVFVDYMKNHFIKFLPERTNESVLLILDGFKSHLCVELIGFTKDNNILTQFIPANCDRSLSPIEHCCSAQLQDCYDEICLRKIHSNEPIYFCDVACEAYNEAFSQEILGEAFVKSGLCSIENHSAV